jgi:hypothetical protein
MVLIVILRTKRFSIIVLMAALSIKTLSIMSLTEILSTTTLSIVNLSKSLEFFNAGYCYAETSFISGMLSVVMLIVMALLRLQV